MSKPEDLSPAYRKLFEAFRSLGLSESAAMEAALEPADRPRHGPLSHPPTMQERAARYADGDGGRVVEEAFGALDASVVGREGGGREAAVRSFSEAVASVGRHPATAGDFDFGPLIAQLDPSLQKLAGELTEAGVRHVRQQFEWYSDGTFAGKPVRALELALASEARAQRAGGKAIEVAEVAGRVVVREVTGR